MSQALTMEQILDNEDRREAREGGMTHTKWVKYYGNPFVLNRETCPEQMLADWTEDREQQYQAGYKQGEVHTIAKWREDREQLQTEIELYSRHRVKLQADKAKLVKVLLETTNVLEWMSKHCYQQPLAKKAIAKARAVLKEVGV